MTKDMAVMKKLLEKVREKKTDMEAWTASMAGVAQQGVSLTATPILGQNNVEVSLLYKYSLAAGPLEL